MLCDWRLRLFLCGVLVCLYVMISSLISVTRMDARTLAERRIHSADVMELSGGMLGGQFDRRLIVRRNQERKRPGVSITWCKQLGLKAAPGPGPVTALASFPGSGNTWLRYLLQQATGKTMRGGYSTVCKQVSFLCLRSVHRKCVQRHGSPKEWVSCRKCVQWLSDCSENT